MSADSIIILDADWSEFPRIFTSFTVNCKIMMYGRDVDRNDNRAATEVVAMFL